MKFRTWLAAGFLLFQMGFLASRPLHHTYYWAWAPFHEAAWYSIHVTVGDVALSNDEIRARYHLKTWFENGRGELWQSNAMWWVFRAVAQTEERLHADKTVTVEIQYRLNGAPATTWKHTWIKGDDAP